MVKTYCDICNAPVTNGYEVTLLYADGNLVDEWKTLKVFVGATDAKIDLCSDCKKKVYDFIKKGCKL